MSKREPRFWQDPLWLWSKPVRPMAERPEDAAYTAAIAPDGTVYPYPTVAEVRALKRQTMGRTSSTTIAHWAGGTSGSGSPLKFMAPGHFCPDVCGIEDFGEADYLRGKVVRAFFRLMRWWPKPTAKTRRL